MASVYFLKIDGIEGQASDAKHEKWLDLLSFSHGSLQNINVQASSDVQGRGQYIPFTFTHAVDKATPKLQLSCMKGEVIKSAKFEYCRVLGGAQTPVYELTLNSVRVAKAEIKTVNPNPEDAASQQPVEEVQLVAAEITVKVTPIKPDGTKDGAIETKWNQVTNS
ncbi:MAG: type VI secretion system tube protein Hcp [Spirochaetaceae bacterium]|jgi:type VI secretion system secreted protein Hcp|nr:type VI secretion system tube protein Hcp [Spirochaetaceae bacterium]